MFGMFKKGSNKEEENKKNVKAKAVTEEGKMLSKAVSPNVTGILRESIEKMAYVLENDLNKKHHVITYVVTETKEGRMDSADIMFMRTSSSIFGEIMMQVGMNDNDMAEAIIAVSEALQYQKESNRDYAIGLRKQVADNISDGTISAGTFKTGKSKNPSYKTNDKGEVGFNIEKLAEASEEEVDSMIEDLLKDDSLGLNKDDEDPSD
jgi:hypothetical protein